MTWNHISYADYISLFKQHECLTVAQGELLGGGEYEEAEGTTGNCALRIERRPGIPAESYFILDGHSHRCNECQRHMLPEERGDVPDLELCCDKCGGVGGSGVQWWERDE